MNNNEKEMREFVENLVKSLQARGIKVNSATLLNIEDNEELFKSLPHFPVNKKEDVVPQLLPGQVDMDKVKDILQKLGANGINIPKDLSVSSLGKKEKCFCPNCYNFTTFEEVLQEEGSVFDYNTLKIGGSEYDVKYHRAPNGDERIMINKVEKTELGGLSIGDLQKELSESVQDKDFAYSQQILNEIQKRKNKN